MKKLRKYTIEGHETNLRSMIELAKARPGLRLIDIHQLCGLPGKYIASAKEGCPDHPLLKEFYAILCHNKTTELEKRVKKYTDMGKSMLADCANDKKITKLTTLCQMYNIKYTTFNMACGRHPSLKKLRDRILKQIKTNLTPRYMVIPREALGVLGRVSEDPRITSFTKLANAAKKHEKTEKQYPYVKFCKHISNNRQLTKSQKKLFDTIALNKARAAVLGTGAYEKIFHDIIGVIKNDKNIMVLMEVVKSHNIDECVFYSITSRNGKLKGLRKEMMRLVNNNKSAHKSTLGKKILTAVENDPSIINWAMLRRNLGISGHHLRSADQGVVAVTNRIFNGRLQTKRAAKRTAKKNKTKTLSNINERYYTFLKYGTADPVKEPDDPGKTPHLLDLYKKGR